MSPVEIDSFQPSCVPTSFSCGQNPHVALPPGFPNSLKSKMAWSNQDVLENSARVVHHLNQEQVIELETAVNLFKASGEPLYTLSPTTFPLPGLSARFAELKQNLHAEYGFFVICGLEPDRYNDLENNILHVGIASYFGNKRALQQNHTEQKAEALLHVTDIEQRSKRTDNETFVAPGNQSIAMGFHSDSGDNVSLYCRRRAVVGGELYLASAWQIYNTLAVHHPGELQVLAAPWIWQESRTGDPVLHSRNMPLIYFLDGKLVVNYQKRPLKGTPEEPRDERLSPLTAEQLHALKIVDEIARSHAITMMQQPGDMTFFNNLSVLHARNAFVDEGGAQYRHLTRLIFRDETSGWAIPEKLQQDWKKYYDHHPSVEHFPLQPAHWAFSLTGHD